jgi:hypothetical protein
MRHHKAKITEEQVREIRKNIEGKSDRVRAQLLGIHPCTVKRIRWGLTWKHVP